VQAYEGVVIGRRNRGLNSSFVVRKVSSGEGVERTFQLYSPTIASIEVKRRGDVRRAKLYYLRDRSGKSARIREKLSHKSAAEKRLRTRRGISTSTSRGAARAALCVSGSPCNVREPTMNASSGAPRRALFDPETIPHDPAFADPEIRGTAVAPNACDRPR